MSRTGGQGNGGYERFQPDAVWLSADTWITAEAMGAAVAFPGPNQPMAGTGETLVRSAADISRLPAPDPHSRGRMPLMSLKSIIWFL